MELQVVQVVQWDFEHPSVWRCGSRPSAWSFGPVESELRVRQTPLRSRLTSQKAEKQIKD